MKSREFAVEAAGNASDQGRAAALAHVDEMARHLQYQVEREIEWTLTDHYDSREVAKLIGPVQQALNNLVRWADQQQAPAESVQEMSAGGTGAGSIALGGGNGFGVRSPFGAHRSGKNPFKKPVKRK